MGEAWDWVKAHPWYVAGGILVGLIVLYYLLRSPAASPAPAQSDLSGYYAAQAASATSGNNLAAVADQVNGQIAIATLQEQTKQQAIAGQVSLAGISSQHDIALANIAAGVTSNNNATTVSLAGLEIPASLELAANNNLTAEHIAGITSAGAVAQNQTNADAAVAIANTNAVASQNIAANSNAAAVSIAGINAGSAADLANIAAGVTANNNATALGIATNTNAANVQLAQIGAGVTQNNNATTVDLANIAAGVTTNNNATAAAITASNNSAAVAMNTANDLTALGQTLLPLQAQVTLADLNAAVATGGLVTTIGPGGTYQQVNIDTGGVPPAATTGTSLANNISYIRKSLGLAA